MISLYSAIVNLYDDDFFDIIQEEWYNLSNQKDWCFIGKVKPPAIVNLCGKDGEYHVSKKRFLL